MVNKRGRPSDEDVESFLSAGYTEKHILAIILAISVKTISNYSNHIFRTPLMGCLRRGNGQPTKHEGTLIDSTCSIKLPPVKQVVVY
jgi:hypothetical protein